MFLLGPRRLGNDIFYAFPPAPSGRYTFFRRKIEKEEGRRREREKKNEGEMHDRRQKKWRRETHQRGEVSLEAEGKMRKKVSLHQTEELPLLQKKKKKKSQHRDWMKRDTFH